LDKESILSDEVPDQKDKNTEEGKLKYRRYDCDEERACKGGQDAILSDGGHLRGMSDV
jgi:hypothetical protein